ncbi:hypothetical protein GCM10007424_22480 [Flavobacterium suaedae]|uniref:Tetratricopeptide repeat protein n=1 Tax=Flavobacterium suaedae TaxID=1767027 RepID=A0ABQ1K3C0_9FLAO|nr:tetratricopeptide repeat protein [Flavobacterium suaedae]GGB81899.1 hypothetical protein GCM10007424_22480 [Flavobacterium suaedae]
MTTEELIEKAEQLFKEEEYQEIIELLPDELLAQHNNAYLYMLRGVIFEKLNDLDKAIKDYNKAIEINPTDANLYFNRGNSWHEKGEYTRAIEDYNKVIEINPKDADAYQNRGFSMHKKGELDEAIKDYNKAIEINPTDANAYNNRGNALNEKEEYNRAIEDYNKAVEINPKYSDPYNNRGLAWHNKGELDKAIKDYDKAIEINPKNIIFYLNRGNSWYKKEKFDKAIEDYNKAIKINPKHAKAYYNRGNIWQIKGNFKDAINDFEKYLKLVSDKNDYWAKQAKENIKELEFAIKIPSYSAVSNIVEQIKSILVFEEDCVTHYTSLSTAKILILEEKSTFRLSEGAFLNDTSEGRALFNFLNNFHITEQTNDRTIAEPFTEKPFIGSFVPKAKHDDLTLWRMYGKENDIEAKGCALTINREKFVNAIKESINKETKTTPENSLITNSDFTFYRVAYLDKKEGNTCFTIPGPTDDDKEMKLNDLMSELAKHIEENEINEEDKVIITEKLNEIAYLFKSTDYLYEHEVRLIIDGVGFKKGIDNETPKVYIELVDIRPALHQITLGPKIEKAEEWASTFNYYLKQNYEDQNTEIVISHLPFK